MNNRPIITTPDSGGRGNWVDAYMAENQLAHHHAQPRLFNLSTIRGILFRQRWLVAGIILASAIAGIVLTLLATPMYEARATVRIEPYGSYIVEGQNVDQGISANQVYDLLSTQIGIITSRSLANSVAEDLNLGERNDFLGPEVDDARRPDQSDEEWLQIRQTMAAAKLHASISADIPDNNWIIELLYRSSNPAIAAEMANAYSAAFAATDIENSIADNEYAQTYLLEQIGLVRERLRAAEQAANSYARNNSIIVQPSVGEEVEGNMTLTSVNLASVNARFSAARASRIEAEQRWRSVQNLPASQLPEVQGSPVIQTLVADRTTKQTQLVDLRQRYADDFPQVTNLREQIEALNAQIAQSSADIKASVRNDYLVSRNQEQALERELNAATGSTLAEQDLQVQYSALEREAQALGDQLQALLNRFNEVSAAANVQSDTINPLDAAVVPNSPYAPSLVRNLALALIMGAAAAASLAVLRETLDDRVRSLDEIEERIDLPLLGHTPYVEGSGAQYEGLDRYGSLLESYASIRAAIDFALPGDYNVLQLTSSQAREGKSTTALVLAEQFASLGGKVLLIDADIRRPAIAKLLNIARPKTGLVEVLLGQADFDAAVIKGVRENLEILPSGQPSSNPSEIFASHRLREFIAKYRAEYSLIIFDSSPILGLADAPLLSGVVDATILVMEANNVHFSQVRTSLKRLRASGGNPLGAILTKYRALEAGESYNYQYGYYEYESSH